MRIRVRFVGSVSFGHNPLCVALCEGIEHCLRQATLRALESEAERARGVLERDFAYALDAARAAAAEVERAVKFCKGEFVRALTERLVE